MPRPAAAYQSGADDPTVWTGRALQAESDDLEVIGLALLYPLNGTFAFLAIMDIRARPISFAPSTALWQVPARCVPVAGRDAYYS
jgi:hypothetical protein